VVGPKKEGGDVVVVNMRHEKCDVRVDRRSKWGNPFVMAEDTPAERDRVVEAYRRWLWQEIKTGKVDLIELAQLGDKRLGCWCKPKSCHAEVLLRAADWAREQLEP
jgi:hypothetical protein